MPSHDAAAESLHLAQTAASAAMAALEARHGTNRPDMLDAAAVHAGAGDGAVVVRERLAAAVTARPAEYQRSMG